MSDSKKKVHDKEADNNQLFERTVKRMLETSPSPAKHKSKAADQRKDEK